MASRLREIPYGRANAANPGPLVHIVASAPLRLCDAPYAFDEPPDLVRLVTVEERMGFLCEHLKSLCGPWDKLSRLFLDAYFAGVAKALEAAAAELDAASRRAGGLFAPEDWSFCALRPLPQAHLGEGDARADIAFWTGERFVAVFAEGSMSPQREERLRRERIAEAGAELVRVPPHALAPGRFDLSLLPKEFARFWEGVEFPASPFGPEALGEF